MKTYQQASASLAITAVFCLSSCSMVSNVGKGSVALVKNTTSTTVTKISAVKMPKMPDFHLADLLPGNRIKVVEVREKDLKELPMGTELAKAHERERKAGFWIFNGPVDFQEPSLPEPGADLDGSLLPPRMP